VTALSPLPSGTPHHSDPRHLSRSAYSSTSSRAYDPSLCRHILYVVENETPWESLLAQICHELLEAGSARLPFDPDDLDVTAGAELAQEASTRLQRPVQIREVDGILTAKLPDWPATSRELEVSMREIRREIQDIGGTVQLTP